MLTLVSGGSASGKSEFAESLVVNSGCENRWYLATMLPYDEECHRRIARHRKMHRDRRLRRADADRHAMVLHQKPDLLRQVIAEQVGPVCRPDKVAAWFGMAPAQAGCPPGVPRLHTRTRPGAWAQWAAAAGQPNIDEADPISMIWPHPRWRIALRALPVRERTASP